MSRYDLTDFEWRVIEPLLPNKPEGACHATLVESGTSPADPIAAIAMIR